MDMKSMDLNFDGVLTNDGVTLERPPAGILYAEFTLVHTPIFYDKINGTYIYGDHDYMDCIAWGNNAEHIYNNAQPGVEYFAKTVLSTKPFKEVLTDNTVRETHRTVCEVKKMYRAI